MEAVDQKKWIPICPCRNDTTLSHLFFADDLVLMGKATVSTTRTIREVLGTFCMASGLKLNQRKSKVIFSNSGGANLKRTMCN